MAVFIVLISYIFLETYQSSRKFSNKIESFLNGGIVTGSLILGGLIIEVLV